jgi:hypothetical protein
MQTAIQVVNHGRRTLLDFHRRMQLQNLPRAIADRPSYPFNRAILSTCTAIMRSSWAGATNTAVFDSDALILRTPCPFPSFAEELIEIPRL